MTSTNLNINLEGLVAFLLVLAGIALMLLAYQHEHQYALATGYFAFASGLIWFTRDFDLRSILGDYRA